MPYTRFTCFSTTVDVTCTLFIHIGREFCQPPVLPLAHQAVSPYHPYQHFAAGSRTEDSRIQEQMDYFLSTSRMSSPFPYTYGVFSDRPAREKLPFDTIRTLIQITRPNTKVSHECEPDFLSQLDRLSAVPMLEKSPEVLRGESLTCTLNAQLRNSSLLAP